MGLNPFALCFHVRNKNLDGVKINEILKILLESAQNVRLGMCAVNHVHYKIFMVMLNILFFYRNLTISNLNLELSIALYCIENCWLVTVTFFFRGVLLFFQIIYCS